jgi:hypothetical protein
LIPWRDRRLLDVQDPFADVPRLAERLGVEPLREGESVGVALHTADGRRYSLIGLIEAFLDRLDAA